MAARSTPHRQRSRLLVNWTWILARRKWELSLFTRAGYLSYGQLVSKADGGQRSACQCEKSGNPLPLLGPSPGGRQVDETNDLVCPAVNLTTEKKTRKKKKTPPFWTPSNDKPAGDVQQGVAKVKSPTAEPGARTVFFLFVILPAHRNLRTRPCHWNSHILLVPRKMMQHARNVCTRYLAQGDAVWDGRQGSAG